MSQPPQKPIPNLGDQVDRAITENRWNSELSRVADEAIERNDNYIALEFPKRTIEPDYADIPFEWREAA